MRFYEIIKEREQHLTGPKGIIKNLQAAQGFDQAYKYFESLIEKGQARAINDTGFFSVVYQGTSGGPYVIKLSEIFYEFQSENSVLETFLSKCLQPHSNPLLPRVYAYQIKQDCFWVIMEKLNIKDESTTSSLIEKTFGLTWGIAWEGGFEKKITKLNLPQVAHKIIYDFNRSGESAFIKMRDDPQNKRTPNQKQNFMHFVDLVKTLHDSGDVRFDFKSENIGFRNNGELVIFDPIS